MEVPRVDLKVDVDIVRTPKVTQLEGMFDVPRTERSAVEYHFDAPFDARPWQIGLIVGPSGAGKSTVARHLFGDDMVDEYEWDATKSIVDCFDGLGIRETTAALSSVGFSSPPAWIKPYRVLSNGEKFRCNMARALVDKRELVVIDEFTSVVDRTVAKIGSHAISKAIRKSSGKKFVAVSCHDDIVDWLQPDWVIEPHVGSFQWRSLQRRPQIELEIVRCSHSSWKWFHPHHYLSADLHRGARCFVGLIDGNPAAFAGVLTFPHPRRSDLASLSRIVVMPDFQGIGLGTSLFVETIASIAKSNGKTLIANASHSTVISVWSKSPNWDMKRKPSFQSKKGKTSSIKDIVTEHAKHRRTASFHWCGKSMQDFAMAKKLWS